MNLTLTNIGKVKHSELRLGKLTLLCGKNNTGKTYITYSIYGFLKYLSEAKFIVKNLRKYFNEAIDLYETNIPLSDISNALKESFINYSQQLGEVLAVNNLENATIELQNIDNLINYNHAFNIVGRFRNNKESVHLLQYKKEQKNDYVSIIYTPSDFKENSDDSIDFLSDSTLIKKRLLTTIEHQFKLIITREILKSIPTKVFISSVERTGIAIFKEELDDLVDKNEDLFGFIDPNKDVFKGNYPSAVKDNINSVKKYHRLQEFGIQSELSKESPFILKYFQEIINGEYTLDDSKKSIKYIPKGEHGNQKSLSLIESSSSVRSLLDIGIYIQYFAGKGQTLIIDEPEMNLHPYNQRKVARLIAMLVNYGINVLITTHSDFITREISFLIMMKDEKRKYLLEQEPIINTEYYASQLLSADSVKVYSSDYNLKTKSVSINAENVSSEDGFSIPTFDDTVDRMNEIYNIIL